MGKKTVHRYLTKHSTWWNISQTVNVLFRRAKYCIFSNRYRSSSSLILVLNGEFKKCLSWQYNGRMWRLSLQYYTSILFQSKRLKAVEKKKNIQKVEYYLIQSNSYWQKEIPLKSWPNAIKSSSRLYFKKKHFSLWLLLSRVFSAED